MIDSKDYSPDRKFAVLAHGREFPTICQLLAVGHLTDEDGSGTLAR